MTEPLLIFTGLGRRKADAFLKDYRRQNIRIEHRQKILGVNDDQVRTIGPTVFVNCVGFIRLNTSELGDAEEYVDVFDSTRIHPESFEYGRKMCKDLACQVAPDEMEEDEYENEEYRAVNKVIYDVKTVCHRILGHGKAGVPARPGSRSIQC